MAKRTFNDGDEQLSDAWLLDIFADLPDSDFLTDEALFDVGDDLDALSEPPSISEPSEPHSERDGGCDGSSRVAMQSPMTSLSAPPNDYDANREHIDAAEVIAQELNQMTIGERQAIFEDVNGLTPLNEETPTFLSAKLDDFEVELSLIKEKLAYEAAIQQNSAFVEDDVLRLKFLRCVQYNPLVAAERFVNFFQLKLELFGLALLTEEITIYDLCDDARALLESGKIQKLPIRDSAGRALIVVMAFDSQIYSADAVPAFLFYLCMRMVEDEATQMSGAVGMLVSHGFMPSLTQRPRFPSARIRNIVPLKLQGFHLLSENHLILRHVANILKLAFSKQIRHRCCTHFGSFRKCKEELTSFGIPVSMFPLTDDGEIKMEAHLKWMEKRKVKEAAIVQRRQKVVMEETAAVEEHASPPNGVPAALDTIDADSTNTNSTISNNNITPNDKDVILGRGRPFQIHVGNLVLKEIIADWYDRYNATPRLAKTAVAEQIVHSIEERGGRFLKKRNGAWYEVELPEARDKVSHGFRKKREVDAKLCSTPTKKATSVATIVDGPKRKKVLDDD